MKIYLEEAHHSADEFALYIDGDFQFDTADEPLYHESLAIPPLCLTAPRADTRVLICGGGDGLALRECLRFPGVSRVDLVDYSDEVVQLGKTRFAGINSGAFSDPRVMVHIRDAWDFLAEPHCFDVILCDFTVPRRFEDTRVFSLEWYQRLKESLSAGGVMGINAVSPQTTPEAFWCLNKTIRASGLHTVPYRVCIPSFRDHGYGAWAFILAGHDHRTVSAKRLKELQSPVATRQADISRLWRGARFGRRERALANGVQVNTLANGCLLPLLLNPGLGGGVELDRDWDVSLPYDLNPLLNAIPIAHPYHTRVMVNTLAEQVAGSVLDLDIRRLVDALMKRAAELPLQLMAELRRLRDYIRSSAPSFELFNDWTYRLFAALVIMMTLANAISPDNAFAKGSFGGGAHGGFSVGHSSFGRASGGFESAGRSGSSFGGDRGFSGSFGRSGGSFGRSSSDSSFVMSAPQSPHFTGSGFRTSYGRGTAVDIYGSYEPARIYTYCGSGYGHYHPYTQVYGGTHSTAPPEKHEALFLASQDMSVLDNGDVVVNVADDAYLLLTNGTAALMSSKSPDPLMMMYPDPGLFANVQDQISRQQAGVQNAIDSRREWLSWVGWTSALVPAVAGDKQELKNLQDLQNRLNIAVQRIGTPQKGAVPMQVAADQAELFIGAVLMRDGTVSLRDQTGTWVTVDGNTLKSAAGGPDRKCPPMLTETLKSSLNKLRKDARGGIAADQNDLQQLAVDKSSLYSDLYQYQSLQSQNYGDPNYEVDYGSSEIPVWDALQRTQNDMTQNDSDRAATQVDIDKLNTQLQLIERAIDRLTT